MDKHFLVPGSDLHDAVLALPILCALALLLLLGAIGVWSASRAAFYSGTKDPQFVVVDEVAGQHLALLLPLLPLHCRTSPRTWTSPPLRSSSR